MHYRNGRVAIVGDPVVGTVFNNGGQIVAGTLASVTPGPDACSAMVGYTVTAKTDEKTFKQGYVLVNGKPMYLSNGLVKVQGTEKHGSDGDVAVTLYVQDYTECKNLMHAEDAHQASEEKIAGTKEQPPIDNAHVAEGCQTFGSKVE